MKGWKVAYNNNDGWGFVRVKLSKAEKLNLKLIDVNNKLTHELEKLENWGYDCPCENGSYCEVSEYYGHDDFPSIGRYCLQCGGQVLV